MNIFEAVVLLSPEITSKDRSSCLENLQKVIKDKSGKIINNEDWGLRDLSYKIDNYSKAFYNFYQIEIEGDKIESIKKNLNQELVFLNPNVSAECGCGESFNFDTELVKDLSNN